MSKSDGDVVAEMRWDGAAAQYKLTATPSGGYMPGALGTAALDDARGRLWETNDMGSYKYVTLRQRQSNGAWAPVWYQDVSTEVLPTALFPIAAESAAVGASIASDNKLRLVRYEVDHDSRPLWERPVFPGSYTITVEPDGEQGGIMTIRRASNGHVLVFLLNELGLPKNGFVVENDNVVSSVLVNEDGFAYAATRTPTDGNPSIKVVTRSWANLKDLYSLAQGLADGF